MTFRCIRAPPSRFCCIRHRDSLLACLFWLHRRGWHFVASGTVILFLHVFSDYTGGDDILLPLRKELVVLAAKRIGRVWRKFEGMIFYYTNTIQGILLGFHLMYPMMCTVHHVGSTWHKKWIFEERHASHSSILDLYVWFTRCIFWNAYNDMKMMVYWGESMQKNRECLVHESYTRTELT